MSDAPDPARRVLLLREAEPRDPYEAVLRAAGYEPVSVPVLAFGSVNQDRLRASLENHRAYGGLVLTSPRAVEALAEALRWLPSETVRWHAKAIFAVGPATAKALRETGFQPDGEASGTAELLAEHIARQSYEAPLLFLCGDRRRDTLPQHLQDAGIPMEELCVYETRLREDVDLAGAAGAAWIIFFSPSGLEAVRQTGGFEPGRAAIAAIGPTTAAALAEAGLPPAAVAEEPTPEALLQALQRAGSEHAPGASAG